MSLVWENVASKINVAIQIPSILLNVLLIYLSLFCVPKSVLRKFTLNLAVVCLLCNLYESAFVLMELFASQELLKDSIVVRFEDWKIVIGEIALNIYQFLTTTAILLAYLTFAKPLTYHNFSGRKVTMLFCAVDVLSVTISVSLCFIHEYTESEDPMLIHQIFCWVFFLCFLVSYVLMIYLYIMIAYQAMRRFKRHPEATQHSLNKQWTALASFFVFSTFPNLFLLIAIPDVMCETLLNAVPIEVREYMVFGHCEVAAYIADCLIVPRICICSICALFAFPDYRKAFISLVRRRIAKIASSRTLFVRSNSSIINVTS